MKAMILAAGLGKRLLPLTKDTPKPLLQVGQHTLIEYAINKLIEHGVDDFIINVSYLSEQGGEESWSIFIRTQACNF